MENLGGGAVIMLVKNHKDEILLGKKNTNSPKFLKGQWHIPAETLEIGESDEIGVKRGIREETGIDINVLRYLAFHYSPTDTRVMWYECEPITYDIRAGSDLSDVMWVPRLEVPEMCGDRPETRWPKEMRDYFCMKR